MARRGFVISMDLMMALGIVLIMMVMLNSLSSYEWTRYPIVSDSLNILIEKGVTPNQVQMQDRIDSILPFESYNFTLIDFGSMIPLKDDCQLDANCTFLAPYNICFTNICGRYALNIETGEYQKYSAEPYKYCSFDMIIQGSCKPEGDISQRLFVDMGDDDLVDHFYLIRLEVAE